jgi:hypothetical protein
VKRQRNQLLAGAAASRDQNCRLGVGDFPDQFQDITNRFARAYNAVQLKFHDALRVAKVMTREFPSDDRMAASAR